MDKETTKMIPGDELHLTMLMAPYSLNLVTGQDRQHLLAYGRAAFDAGNNTGQATPCLNQIAEPVTAGAAVRAFRDYLGVHDGIKLGGQAMDDMALDLARIALDFKHLVESQHPDEAAVDALAALMKAKLAEKRAKGYGGWNDKNQCPQQRLSDMLRAHVDKGDPVDVANFCAMLSARGEGIAAAPQAVQAAEPEGWKLAPIKVPDSAFAWVSGGYPAGFKAGDKRDTAVVHERAQRTWEAILNGITAPAPAAVAGPDERAAFEQWLGIKPCGAAHDFGWAAWRARAAPAATHPAAQGAATTGYIAPKGRYVPPVLFSPYTGEPRDARDIASDPRGILIVPPGAALAAQAKQGGAA